MPIYIKSIGAPQSRFRRDKLLSSWWRIRLAAPLVFLALLLAGQVQAAITINVNHSLDGSDSNPNDSTCSAPVGASTACTLRAAIQTANYIFSQNIATDVTILLGNVTYTLSIAGAGEDNAATGDLDIRGTCGTDINQPCLKIVGTQGQTIIDGGGIDRVFHFVGKNTVRITGVIIQNGSVTNDNGGGIKNSNGWVTLKDCEVINNTVGNTTGARYSGGGVFSGAGTQMAIKNCTIKGNRVNNAQGTFRGDFVIGGGGGGGGIRNSGNMTLSNSTVMGNYGRPFGGGIMNTSGFGGDDGKLTIISSTLQGNQNIKDDSSPNGVGGALSNQGGLVKITQSIISGNAALEGGGVFNTNLAIANIPGINSQPPDNGNTTNSNTGNSIQGSVQIAASVIDSNTGNGLSNKDAMDVRYSTISNNTAQPFEYCADESKDPIMGCTNGADGGGINNYGPGKLTVENSTITGNTARNGGGISNGRSLTLASATVSGNSANAGGKEIFVNIQSSTKEDATAIQSSIIGDNTLSANNCMKGDGQGAPAPLVAGVNSVNSKGYNLENGNSCALTGIGDLPDTNPNLGLFMQNEGSVETVLPDGTYPKNFMPGSPAIGKGVCPSPSFDQRQFGRPGVDGLCDIGSVESDGDPAARKVDLEVQKTANVATVVLNGSVIYTLTVTNHGPNIAENIVLKDRLPAGVSYVRWAEPVPSTNPPGVGCTDPTPSADFTCTLANLARDKSFTVYLTVKVTDPSLVPTSPTQIKTIENMSAVTVTSPSPADYLPGSNGSITSCVRGACAITRVLEGDGVTNFTPSGGGGVFGPWALLLLGVPGLFLLRRRA